ncbi:unnamed protein product, partial [Lymnaea stagnalis]
SKQISSFLVTNAQFPKELRDLLPVAQLYVSVDAGTKESLKKIDRPLFKDFWERYIDSLTALRDKGQRTVYRLTLVKSWSTEELDNYAKLVSRGNPDFIEVKFKKDGEWWTWIASLNFTSCGVVTKKAMGKRHSLHLIIWPLHQTGQFMVLRNKAWIQ